MHVTVHMSVHNRSGRLEADAMRRPHYLKPSLGADLVGTEHLPNVVVEDLGSRREIGRLAAARRMRERAIVAYRPHGDLVSYSRKVFIPLSSRRRAAARRRGSSSRKSTSANASMPGF
jgi:hypothetical protein